MTDAFSVVIKTCSWFLTSLVLTVPVWANCTQILPKNIAFFILFNFFEQRDNAIHLEVSFRTDSIMICLISTLRLIGMFMLSVPLTSRLFPQEFRVAVCASRRCHQQSQRSANCTTVPSRRVSATAPVEIEEGVGGQGIWKRRLLQLFGNSPTPCLAILKSHVRLGICAQEPKERTFYTKGLPENGACLLVSAAVQRH